MNYRQLMIGVVLSAGIVTASQAATSKDHLRKQAEAACAGDATRLCGDYVGDEAKSAECMKQNMAQVSPACRKASKALGR